MLQGCSFQGWGVDNRESCMHPDLHVSSMEMQEPAQLWLGSTKIQSIMQGIVSRMTFFLVNATEHDSSRPLCTSHLYSKTAMSIFDNSPSRVALNWTEWPWIHATSCLLGNTLASTLIGFGMSVGFCYTLFVTQPEHVTIDTSNLEIMAA